jgi:hypothetical protein
MARDQAGFPYGMRDLFKRSESDPLVKSILHAWSTGRYPSLEAALIGLAVSLSDEKARLQKRLSDVLRGRGGSGKLGGPETG